jgi:hypothetical protein
VNQKSKSWFSWTSNHWFSIARLKNDNSSDCWALLDSKKDAPLPFDSLDDIEQFLESIRGPNVNILVVKRNEMDDVACQSQLPAAAAKK